MTVRIADKTSRKAQILRDYASETDESLMAMFQNGDSLAFHFLIERHRGLVWAQVRKFFGPSADIEDIIQDVSLSLWQNRASWKPGIAKFSTWLYRVAANRCIDILRQKREIATDKTFDHVSSDSASAEDNISGAQLSRHLQSVLATLPAQQKTALHLFYYEDAGIEQICSRMDLSEQAVRSLLKRGKQKLRLALQPDSIYA